MKEIKYILKNLRFKTTDRLNGLKVKNVTCDSRKVKPGGLFVAVKGSVTDGAIFIDQAVSSGARVVISETDFLAPKNVAKIIIDDSRKALPVIAANFYGHPSKKLKTVGVTGTNGKTTITYIIESIIKQSGKDCGVIGTINYRFRDKAAPARNTTPGPIELQSILAEMASKNTGYAVMEVSSHSLDQRRVDGILFDVGIFTNVTSDHLDYHKTPANYFKAKKRLFDNLKSTGTAVLNIDDKKVASIKRFIKKKVITYGLKRLADVRAENVKLSIHGSGFDVITPKGVLKIETALIGSHNISNILAGAAASIALGIKTDSIVKGIKTLKIIPGRLEAVEAGQDFRVFVDYAHTEDALHNILSLLREVSAGSLITVFGCGGNRDRTKRPLMGKTVCRFSDRVVMTSDNPRFEDPSRIIAEIEAGVKGEFSNYDIVVDRRRAIVKALRIASKGDIVVIAGKGHEDYQIIKDRVLHFDDRETVRDILSSKQVEAKA